MTVRCSMDGCEGSCYPGAHVGPGREIVKAQESVIEGVTLTGRINVEDEVVLANIRHSIRLGYPQIYATNSYQNDRIALLGGGPSLNDTIEELRQVVYAGAKIVTVNGSYQWAIEHNFRPSAQVLVDARAFNARFLEPYIPSCRYYLSSQCHPESWASVEGRENVAIFHSHNPESTSEARKALDDYYLGRWQSVNGGSTVTTRAIGLLRALGYLRYDLFGVDSCWMGESNHAYEQAENSADERLWVTANSKGHPEQARRFSVSPWHLKQLEDILNWMRAPGHPFVWNVHGDGLVAFAFQSAADFEITEE